MTTMPKPPALDDSDRTFTFTMAELDGLQLAVLALDLLHDGQTQAARALVAAKDDGGYTENVVRAALAAKAKIDASDEPNLALCREWIRAMKEWKGRA